MHAHPAPRRAAALALLAAALCATAGCATAVCDDAWLGPDKARHFAAGFAIGAATTVLARDGGAEPAYDPSAGVAVVAELGEQAYALFQKGAPADEGAKRLCESIAALDR